MSVPVMDVGVVRMRVDKFPVAVPVGVRFAGRIIRAVDMLMMHVVMMKVLVLHQFMAMLMLVAFGQVEPDAKAHQNGGNEEANRQLVT